MSQQNGIEVLGVSQDIVIKTDYFKEFDFKVNIKISEEKIERILATNVSITVSSIDIIKTPVKISNEGVYFSGHKLKIELMIDIKTKYIINTFENDIGLNSNRIVKLIYIVIPIEKNGEKLIDILRKKRIDVNTYIEDIYCEFRNFNIIYTNISAIVEADIKPY